MYRDILNFCSFEQLNRDGFTSIPNEKGIYMVIVPDGFNVIFTEYTTAISEYKGQNLIYPTEVLSSKFNNSDQKILYIGKAGGNTNKLRQRISQFVRYGYQRASNHRGGRAIWQIKDNKHLLIGYFVFAAPENKERELLQEYANKYGVLPVANWL